MIVIWTTDPAKGDFANNPQKYSSFYMYETVSKQFVRVRLELGRNDSNGGDTFSRYKKTRTIGFSDQTYLTRDLARWSLDAHDKLCYDGTPLSQTPEADSKTYDCTDVTSFVHRGNAVTANPNFPPGIESKHLLLVANETLINKTNITFTNSAASGENLAEALKTKVSAIVKKPFDQINDNDILNKLKEQSAKIKQNVLKRNEETIESAIDEVDGLISEINDKMEEGEFTPDQNVQDAFTELNSRIATAKTTVINGTPTEITTDLDALRTAQTTLAESVSRLSSAQSALFKDAFTRSSASVNEAYEASVKWEAVPTEFRATEEATTVEEYEESIKAVEQ